MKKAQAGHLGPLVIVQWIEVEWGKEARGAEAATKRNALPLTYALPELELKPDSRIVVQKIGRTDHDNFKDLSNRSYQYCQISSAHLISLELIQEDALLKVVPRPRQTGAGRSPHYLPLDQWSQFIWNERVVYESTWRYQQITANIGFVSVPFDSVFFEQAPLDVWSELVHLY